MSAESINIATIHFPNPDQHEGDHYDALSVRSSDKLVRIYPDHELIHHQLQANQSFQLPITDNIQTLSSKGVAHGHDPYGLLYVPDLRSDACRRSEREYIAENATRLANLPNNTGYALIAVAPWYSPECVKEYFAAAREQLVVQAFMVYQPGNSTDRPPETNDASWGLDDGGSWQYANQFPTYAIPPAIGGLVAHQLSLYSGNMSTAPYGDSLEKIYNPRDYIKLFAQVTAESGTQLPSLWVFLVIVLGLLLFVIGCTSLCMHLVQKRRRRALQRRVVNGEVDLEALGIKRLTVPEDYLMKLPVYPYPGESQGEKDELSTRVNNVLSPGTDAAADLKPNPLSRHSSAPDAPPTHSSAIFSQSTCPICLDDFEPSESQVRELPCRHIFHVDCIDTFLLHNSSLCPICKQSVLPVGYCPAKITNIMVRRERIIRSRRSRGGSHQPPAPGNFVARLPGAYDSVRARVAAASGGRRIFSAPARTSTRPSDNIEMTSGPTSRLTAQPVATTFPPSEIVAAPASTHGNAGPCPEPLGDHPQQRREWARQRAIALLGNRHIPADTEEDHQNTSRWKRGLRKIFPGFR